MRGYWESPFLKLLVDPGSLYQRASDGARRDLPTAFFDRLVVYVTEEGIKIEAERRDVNLRIREIHGHIALARQDEQSTQNKTPRSRAGSSVSVSNEVSSFDQGLSNYDVAGVPGLEPRTTEPESAVLPITPYPKGVRPKPYRGSSLAHARGAAKPARRDGSRSAHSHAVPRSLLAGDAIVTP